MTQTKQLIRIPLLNGNVMQVLLISRHTFRIRLNPAEMLAEPPLIRYRIIELPQTDIVCTSEQTSEHMTIETEEATIQIDIRDGQFTVNNLVRLSTVRSAAPPHSSVQNGFSLQLRLEEDEKLYGLGNIYPEFMQRRGLKADMWTARNLPSDSPIPYLMSSNGWAIFMTTIHRHIFDVGCTMHDQLSISCNDGELDFILFVGIDYAQLLDRYTTVVGKPRLLPIWAYGLNYSCRDEDDIKGVLDDALNFRRSGIPCDLIGLSYGWLEVDQRKDNTIRWKAAPLTAHSDDNYRKVSFSGILERHGFKLSLLLNYGYDLTAEEENNAMDKSIETRDVRKRAWYEHVKQLVDEGVSAFLMLVHYPILKGTDARAANGMTESELHNLHPVLMGKQMHLGFQKQTGKRPMIHMVAGYSGIQQYVASTSGRYQNREEAAISLLNYGMSGHTHTSTNMNPITREEIHFGFLLSWARINSQTYFRHPFWLENSLNKMFQKYARLRYRLIPYLYSTAYTATRTGMPMMRAMPLVFPHDPHCAELNSEYMLGDYLLVAVFTTDVYLPEGLWVDFWTGERYEGPLMLDYPIPEEAGGPLFVRGGAILPMWPDMDCINHIAPPVITLHIYPNENSDYTIYEDDGTTFNDLNGAFAVTRIRCETNREQTLIEIDSRNGTYDGMPKERGYKLMIHSAYKPSHVHLNDETLPEQTKGRTQGKGVLAGSWSYTRKSKTIQLYVEEMAKTNMPIRVAVIASPKERRASLSNHRSYVTDPQGRSETLAAVEAMMAAALDAGDTAMMHATFRTWWLHEDISRAPEEYWRLRFVKGLNLLVAYIERQGWNSHEVLGGELDSIFELHETATADQGYFRLCRLAERIFHYAMGNGRQRLHPAIQKILMIIEQDISADLSLKRLAERVAVHPFHLSRLFRKETGKTLTEHIRSRRMERAKPLLESGAKVYEAAVMVGFKDIAHFSKTFSKYWGVSPKYFKSQTYD